MDSIRISARRRGLRAAAQVASIAGIVAASAALSHAAPAPTTRAAGDEAAPSGDESAASSPFDVANALRVRNAGNCGCAPCWGPPAPPEMRPELFDREEDAA